MAVRGQWVTALPLTVLEAAVALGEHGAHLMDSALQRRVKLDALRKAFCRNLGTRGSARARQLLTAAGDGLASAAERRAISLIREAGLVGWHSHYRVDGFELDIAFPDRHVAVEVDGWAWHHSPQSFQHDRARQNALVLAGWTVLRFTWHDLNERPGQVIHEIRMALKPWLPAPQPRLGRRG